MNYEILEALAQITRQRGVDRDLVVETLRTGLLAGAKKRFGTVDNIEIEIGEESGGIRMTATKTVVEEVNKPAEEMDLESAREIKPDAEIGDTVEVELSFEDFGRNAIQVTKQILLQRVREAERERIYNDFHARIGEIVTGTVQQIDRRGIIVNLGRTEAVLPLREQMHTERYRQGNTVRAYILDVLKTSKGPQVVLSRTHPEFLEKLFQLEVPEIYEGIVTIKAVAREPGDRSKIAVVSKEEKIDPVGACVGLRGSRVQAIVRELSGEKIDIVQWSPDPNVFVSRALSPAKVGKTVGNEASHRITVVIPDDQLSLAIGKGGQNARLAAKLTGWRIDMVSESEYGKRLRHEELLLVELDELPGVGEKLEARLLAHGLDSAQRIRDAGKEALLSVKGVGEKTAERLLDAAAEAIAVREVAVREIEEAERAAAAAEKAAEEAAAEAREETAGEEVEEAAEEAAEAEAEALDETAGEEIEEAAEEAAEAEAEAPDETAGEEIEEAALEEEVPSEGVATAAKERAEGTVEPPEAPPPEDEESAGAEAQADRGSAADESE
jgi:N utilization substance protein A